MNRRAIIIEASCVPGEIIINGALKDSVNWRKFLNIDLGGDWSDDEIIVLHTPTKAEVLKKISESQSDYLFVTFSGHGGALNGDEVICLKDDTCSIWTIKALIKKQSPKATLILDCCRADGDADVIVETALNSAVSASRTRRMVKSSGHKDSTLSNMRTFCKTGFPSSMPTFESSAGVESNSANVWFKALNECDKGLVIMWACSRGESAGEDGSENPDVGGYFSTALMVAAYNWNKITQQLYCVYNTKEAFDDALQYIPDSQQNPVYLPEILSFPFAISSL